MSAISASGSDDHSGLPLIFRTIFKRLGATQFGSLDVVLPGHGRFSFQGRHPGPHGEFILNDIKALSRIAEGDVGLAEAYLQGEWETPNLTGFLQFLGENQNLIEAFTSKYWFRLMQNWRHWRNRNSREGSRRNIYAHYDLGNAFYSTWLDGSMTYSSGLGVEHDLSAAQERKYAAIAAAAGIKPQHHVLEIGCGWGGFAEYAARALGCKITALTISKAQYDYARQRIFAAGLSDKVDIQLCDYRDCSGQYDAIVSIEMFEAVGEAYWPGFFNILQQRLKPGAQAALQVITIREDVFRRYRKEMDFIRHYIFPGGMLPTRQILQNLGEKAGLALVNDRAFGLDYARTCEIWRHNFTEAWPKISESGFDQRFFRLWTYYLSYCEAGFRAGSIDVHQVGFRRPA